MSTSIKTIELLNLSLALLPVAIVFLIYFFWSLKVGNLLYSLLRMFVQLLIIGYFLAYIFMSESAWVILTILLMMVLVSSWIALNTVPEYRLPLLKFSMLSILIGGGVTLAVIIFGVLDLSPWYLPQYMIPLAGMTFSNSLNSVSLAAERFYAESRRGVPYVEARNIAFNASLIPVINSLFAVGLVAIPGMMTGQILSGVDPTIAARYQIMVMLMILGSAGISTALFLWLLKSKAPK